MLGKRKSVEEEKGATSLLDYFGIVGDGIVLLWPGVFIAGWEFSGPDMDSLEDAESWQIAHRLANKLKLGRGWTIQCDIIRGEYHEYCPESQEWPDPISYMIDRERRFRYNLTGEAAPRLSRYFLTLSYEPKLKASRRAARFVFLNDSQEGAGPNEQALRLFQKRIGEIDAQLKANMASARRMRTYRRMVGEKDQLCDEMMQHVRRCITGEDHPFAVPRDPSQLHELLNQYLATDDITGGAEPQSGDPLNYLLPGKRIAVISIDAFPEESWAGIMRELDGIPFDFRYTQAGQILDELEAKESHEANKGRWKGKKRPDRQKLLPVSEDPLALDQEAARLELDAAEAAGKAEYGKETSVRFSAKVIVTQSDAALLKRTIDAVVNTIKHNCGFGCRIETINAVAAWLSSFPGQHYKEPRLFLVNVNNMVDMMPLSAPYRGLACNPSKYYPPKSPPLMYAVTSGGTPFRLHQNVGETGVGHELVLGPTGAGKSVYLGAKAAQFFRFPNAQVYVFDKKKSMYTLCKAMGGIFHDVSPDNGPQFCPLADLETLGERDWAAQVIELLLDENGLSATHEERSQIKQTLELLNEEPNSGRSLSDFVMAIQSQRIKNGLQVYLGGILDAESDSMAMSRFCVFEMDELYRLDKKVMNGALFCILGKIRRRLDSSIPTLIMADEFREALEHPMAAKGFSEYMYEGRKLNMAVILVLHDLAKALASPLRGAILQSCVTKTCLANPHAMLEAAEHYETLGCNGRDRELIAYAEPKNHYYVMSPDGKRMVSFEFGELALSFLACSSDEDRREVDRLIEREGDGWQAAWLRQKGLHDWADLHEELKSKRVADYRYAAKETAVYA